MTLQCSDRLRGRGGFSRAIGEMGEELGAAVHLDQAPLKYDGLSLQKSGSAKLKSE